MAVSIRTRGRTSAGETTVGRPGRAEHSGGCNNNKSRSSSHRRSSSKKEDDRRPEKESVNHVDRVTKVVRKQRKERAPLQYCVVFLGEKIRRVCVRHFVDSIMLRRFVVWRRGDFWVGELESCIPSNRISSDYCLTKRHIRHTKKLHRLRKSVKSVKECDRVQ